MKAELMFTGEKVWYESGMIGMILSDKREVRFSVTLNKKLRNASPSQVSNIETSCAGTGLHWPELDEDLSVTGILEGKYGRIWSANSYYRLNASNIKSGKRFYFSWKQHPVHLFQGFEVQGKGGSESSETLLIYLYLTMIKKKDILQQIKKLVSQTDPSATVILYGSQARGQSNKQSDIDILILVDKDKISYSDEQKLKYPLYDLEFETGKVISPLVFSRKDWETRHSITPFYKNVKKDGVLLW